MSEEQQKLAVLAPAAKAKRVPTLYFIVGIKLLKGITALLVAVGAINLTDNNLPEDFRRVLEFLHIDPEKKFFVELADRISDITPDNLRWLAAGSMLYGLFMLVQAFGLAFRVSWAVWLVIGESAFFIPIEVFELVRKRVAPAEIHPHLFAHPKIGVAIILALNIAIVWYLFKNRDRIIRHHRSHS